MNKLFKILIPFACLYSCKQPSFITIQTIGELSFENPVTGIKDKYRDTVHYFANDSIIIQKTYTHSYPSKIDSEGNIIILNLPELRVKRYTGWAIYRKLTDSFCLVVDSAFNTKVKRLDSLSHQTWQLNYDKIRNETVQIQRQTLSRLKYNLIFVSNGNNKNSKDSLILFFDRSKKNNSLVSFNTMPDGKYLVGYKLFSSQIENNKVSAKVFSELHYTEYPITDADLILAKKLVLLYKKHFKD